jgi:hypothetical protein
MPAAAQLRDPPDMPAAAQLRDPPVPASSDVVDPPGVPAAVRSGAPPVVPVSASRQSQFALSARSVIDGRVFGLFDGRDAALG